MLALLSGFGPGPMPREAAPGVIGRFASDLASSLWTAMGWTCFGGGVAVGVLLMLVVVVAALGVAALLRR